ncbi:polysaccharide biosynthesis/export family protein [Rubritalea marina]|uniref:polysaccharide biosynthesis/export family protein n=1 Tax=Rubritalea marina TaxID=361055 RepID=UPI0003A4DD6C|nr:polysaccharide biosynthesis/export family protein [Rubritalea marina]
MLKNLLAVCIAITAMLFPSLLSAADAKEYQLQKDDTVKMIVFQEEELSRESQIGKSGFVSFPLIGNVKLIGKTLKEAEAEIKGLYEKDYLVNAQVNLSVVGYADKWVIVGGDVRSPGTIRYPEEGALDLRGAVAQAGGVTETADTSSIVVRSKSGAIVRYNLQSSGSKVLKHGDSITVPRSTLKQSSITVSGNVRNPGIVNFPKTGKLDILTAIAQAGDFDRIANKKDVIVSRSGRRILVSLRDIKSSKAKMFYMQPGDIVIVQESRF